MARKFLYIVAFLIVVVIGLGIAFSLNPAPFMKTAFVPRTAFVEQAPPPKDSYANVAMWVAHPDMQVANNPALWLPPVEEAAPVEGAANGSTSGGLVDSATAATPVTAPTPADEKMASTEPRRASGDGEAAVFFIHPTSYLTGASWNAPLDDVTANDRAKLFVRGEASVFNEVGQIWAPRYRQASVGAFMTDSDDAKKAIDAAYQDVAAAFDQFLIEVPDRRPIILAGHSQGSLHLTRLLKEKVAGRPIANRIVGAYVVGWPVSVTQDLPSMGLPACEDADSTRCIISWSSFAEPAEPGMVLDAYANSVGFDGNPRGNSQILCTNPLNGMRSGVSAANANLGTLVPSEDFRTGTIEIGQVPARCDERGLLLIGSPPEMGSYVLPGNNYHVYDYPLFWANARADVAHRLAMYKSGKQPPAPAPRPTQPKPVAN